MIGTRLVSRLFQAALPVLLVSPAWAQLQPWKDAEFALPATLSEQDGGAYRVVDYRKERDIDDRDAINERRVRKAWVSLEPTRQQKDSRLKTSAGAVRHIAVGNREGASIIVIYLHGQGGSRKQGADDWSFGGNFNRIKNLMTRNGGLYLSPDVSLGKGGDVQMAELLQHYLERSPSAKLIIACGSAGGRIGHLLLRDPVIANRLDGFLLLGSFPDPGFTSTSAFQARVPVYIGHGSNDSVAPIGTMENFYRSLRSAGVPTRMVRFETGSHGTPIRMTDWRSVINWMLSQ